MFRAYSIIFLSRFYHFLPAAIKWRVYYKFIALIYLIADKNNLITFGLKAGFQMKLNPAAHIDIRIILNSEYEPGLCRILDRYLSKCNSFLDIGANTGFFSFYAATILGKQGKVFSVEASGYNLGRFKKNIALNNFSNITVFPYAAWNREEELKFCDATPQKNGLSQISFSEENTYAVEGKAIDSLNIKADFVKIDIEGAEYQCLLGMKNIIKTCKPYIVMEVTPAYLAKFSVAISDLYQLLIEEFNYTAFIYDYYGKEKEIDLLNIRDNQQLNIFLSGK